MTSSDVTYHEDFFTLRGMTEHFEFSEQLLRQIQKHGLMLPEIVKFGSEEIEIYSNLDIKIGGSIKEAEEQGPFPGDHFRSGAYRRPLP